MKQLIRDRYEPLEVVGEGGEGRLLKALDRQHGRVVALKLRVVVSDVDREAMLNEARVLLALAPHANLPLVRDDFFEDDQYVIVMDWVDGVDLKRVLQTRGRPGLAPSSVVAWLAEAAAALTHLHTQDPPIIHGDVKPANLVLTHDGRIVLVDFGISTGTNGLRPSLGSPGFAAPELLTAPPSRASDVYALAATAYTLLTGAPPTGIRTPWEGIDAEQALALESAIRTGLATDPAHRPATPGEFVERLRAGWGSSLPTGVLTFLLTDIEGSTPLWQRDPVAMAKALTRHDQVMAETVEAHGGRFLQSMGEGDSTVSAFSAADQAVVAAIDCQRRLAAEPWPGALPIAVRMALHTGEADHRGSDYFGPTLSVAARVRGLADGNQVFVSGTTAALVEHALPDGATLVDLGHHRLRGVSATMPIFAIAAAGVDAPRAATECPYQGLLAFDEDDAARFFGRSKLVAELVAHVGRTGFVALVGSSGSGKSSILRAGVLPACGGGEVVTPGEHPPAIAAGTRLLVVDQFEEVFTLCHDDDEREHFIAAVLGYEGPVVLGMRADFYGRCAAHPALAEMVASHQVLLGQMTEDELREVVVEPARACGLRVEPALVDLLVREVSREPGALPLLSHSLLATWEERDGRTLTLDAYHRTGGVRAAIATTADRVLDGLDAHQQQLARRVLLRLVEPGESADDTRRRASLAEFAGPDEHEVAEILARQTEARLVTMDEGSVQLAHEALIREWPRLQQWLDEDRAALRLHRHLTTAAEAWVDAGRDPGELYRGQRLAAATEWRASGASLSTAEEEFVDASVAEEDRALRTQIRANRRLRALLGAVALVLVVALIAGGVAFVQRRNAADSRDRADVSRIAAVASREVERRPDLGLLLAVAARRFGATDETRNTLLGALTAHPLLLGRLYGSSTGLEAAVFSPDGTLIATPTSGTTILWDTRTHQRVATLEREGDNVLDAAFSPDGRRLAVPVSFGTSPENAGSGLQVWEVESRELERFVRSPSFISTAAWSGDGRTVIAQGGVTIGDPAPPSTAVVWDTATWKLRGSEWELAAGYSDDGRLAVSASGNRLALPLPDDTGVQVWDVATRAAVGVPQQPSTLLGQDDEGVSTMALSADGAQLAIGSVAGPVAVVDLDRPGVAATVLRLSNSFASSIEFSPDAGVVAVGRADGGSQLFDRESGAPMVDLAASASAINDVTFSPDGALFVTAGLDRTGSLWSLDGRRSIAVGLGGQRGDIAQAAFGPDGTLLTAAADGSIAVRDGRTGAVERSLRLGFEGLTVAATPSGRLVAAGGQGPTVRTWQYDTGAPGTAIDMPPRVANDESTADAWVHALAFSPDGELLAVAVDYGLGDFETATGPGIGMVRFFDARSGTEVGRPIPFDGGQPISLAWSPDGRRIAIATSDNFLSVWDTRTRRVNGSPIDGEDSIFVDVTFTRDGSRFIAGTTSGATRQFDAGTNEEVSPTLLGQTDVIGGIAQRADGQLLATTALGMATTRLWAMPSARPIADLVGGRVPFTSPVTDTWSRPAFSPDGRHLATVGPEGGSLLWDLRPSTWVRAACSVASRDLTAAEWREHLPGRDRVPLCPS